MALVALLGDSVIDNKGNKISVATIPAKSGVVGLYFSAHWCPPCRAFTPELAKKYPQLKEKGLEIVFVSSDRDEASFKEYHGHMPWLALPFEKRDLKQKLSSKFKVQGIPTLILLDSQSGKLITADGRESFMNDPEGNNFPWKPKTYLEVIGNNFVNNKGQKFDGHHLKNKTVGIYFSAHWCPPCRKFTPELVKTYNTLTAAGKPFEIVFVSSDHDEESFNGYLSEMPWISVPFDDKSRKDDLSTLFKVEGIPTFVIVDGATGTTITREGRASVMADPEGHQFPWVPKLVNELLPQFADTLNESACVIVFAENADIGDIEKVLLTVAKEQQQDAKAREEDADLAFFVGKTHDIVGRVKQVMGFTSDSSPLVVLDIPGGCVYYSPTVKNLIQIDEKAVRAFVADFKAGKLQKSDLQR